MTADVSSPTHFEFEGEQVDVNPGDTLASALGRAGHVVQRITRTDEPRGVFCGIGLCHDCLVNVDGRQGQRACMTSAEDVRHVHRHREAARSEHSNGSLKPLAPQSTDGVMAEQAVDLAIIGAGPAGLAAALHAAKGESDLSILLIDERDYGGGQYFKPDLRPSKRRKDQQHQAGDALRAQFAQTDVAHLTGHTVWYAQREKDDIVLGVLGDHGALLVRPKALILATGAYEQPPMVPGWTLPGVMTIGAAQSLVRSYGVVPGKRVVVAGNGPLGLQLACEMIAAGTPPLAIIERAYPSRFANIASLASAAWNAPDLALKGAQMRAQVKRAGVEILEGWQLAGCTGDGQVEVATFEQINGTGAERRIALDALCVGEGFLPQAELARSLGCACDQDGDTGFLIPRHDDQCATSQPDIWIAGDGGGMGGAQAALAEGEIAALQALRWLGKEPASIRNAKAKLARAKRFQRALWSLYAAPPRDSASDETLLCRCESVSFGDARKAVAEGASDLGALKRQTRLGMGRCQGRYCSGPAARLLGQSQLFAPQSPARPVPIAALALEKPEWGGHRQSELSRARPPERDHDDLNDLPEKADLVIIGAGIMGVAAALHASAAGLDTVVVDRGSINGESSGGNAGSLHMQLLSFDYGEKTGGRSEALLQTLPLQRDAISLWQEHERALETSFEIALTGGLMLAEEGAQIEFLKQKVDAERRNGIEVELIDRDTIRSIAPAVSDKMIAGAWCPGEGKINPLIATPALARVAKDNGARFVEGVHVGALSYDQGVYTAETSAGTIASKHLILAAGGWTGALGAMLGVNLPVQGAPLQMIVTETAPQLAPCLLAHADRHLTMKQASVGNIIIGGAWSAGTDKGSGHTRILRPSLEGNLWVAERVVPDLAGLRMLRSWAAMNVDIDGAPMVGPLPGLPGAVVVAGANGYTLGPLLGQVAAQSIIDGALPAAYRRFSPERFA